MTFTSTNDARAVRRRRRRRTLIGIGLAVSTAVTSALASGPTATVSAAPGDVISSVGREFWLAFNSNYSGGAELTLFITGATDTTGTVEVPGIGFTTPFTVTAGAVTPVSIPTTATLPSPDFTDVKIARGIHVSAGADVSVYGLNYIPFTTDAFLGLPVSALGTDYRVLTYPSFNYQQQVSVVGTVDDTNVTVTPSIALGSRPAGVPYTEVVDRGEVLILPGTSGSPGPTGTRVQSSAPVAVFSGNECGNVPADAFFCDHLVEQLTPTSTWGRRFVTTPLASRQNGDTFRFLAATDATEVRINGTLVATINAGQVYEQILTASSLIETSEPVLVVQFANGSSFSGNPGDPFMMIIPPYEQFLNSYTVTTPASGFVQSYVSVVAPGDGSGITLDGSLIPTSAFSPVGTSGYSAASLPVDPGTHRLSAAQPFGLSIYGFNNDDSYGYSGGFGLAEVASVIRVELTPETGTSTVGTSACVTGRAFATGDAPVTGVRMDFAVTGANTTSGFAITDATGSAEFCYTGTAAGNDSITGTVSGISDTVARTWTDAPPINTPPTANAQSVTTDEDVPMAITLTGTDPDAGTTLTFAVATPPANGTLSGSAANLTYTPAPGFFGSDSFTFTASDGIATSPPATVSITVREVDDTNQRPIAKPIVVSTRQDRAVKVYLNTLDPDGDPTTETITSLPAHGTLVAEGAYFVYTPNQGFVGFDSFTYTTSDGKATSAPATVSIKVGNPPPPPMELRVSDDAARAVDVRALDGQTFRAGEPIYAFVGPQDVFNYIKQVSFWIDDPGRSGPRFSLDTAKEFDLARTAGNGLALPLESNLLALGPHTVTALVEYRNGSTPAVLSATITVGDADVHRLQVSAQADRSQAADLAGASMSGNQYVFLGPIGDAIAGASRVTFKVDGTQVRTDSTVDYDLVGNTAQGTARALNTGTLANGSHEIVATVRLSGGLEIAYRATFTVSN